MTIQEIAELAGVSPTAVSFVLNDRPGVGPEKRAKIRLLLEKYGYQVKQRQPAAKPSGHIKFIKMRAAYQNDYFAAGLLDAVERSAARLGYRISLANLTPESDIRDLFANESEPIDGMIYLASSFTQHEVRQTMKLPFPAVYIDYEEEPDNLYQLNTVNADNDQAAYLAVRHLLSLRHRRIGYLKSTQPMGCLRQRFRFLRQHLSAFGMGMSDQHVIEVDLSQEDLDWQLARKFAALGDLPDAFIAENDVIAAAAVYAMHHMGCRVPEDISVIGFDNTQIAQRMTPGLSTIDVSVDELAVSAVERLQNLIRAPHTAIHIQVGVQLVVRNSTMYREKARRPAGWSLS